MILYHGTTARVLPAILADGIKPREAIQGKYRGKGNWHHTVPSNPRMVYLSRCYALHFASCAAKGNDAGVIIEVETDALDQKRMAPDEDAVEQVTRIQKEADIAYPETIDKTDLKACTLFWRRRIENHLKRGDLKEDAWQQSISALGTCGYYGTIPVSALRRHRVLTPDEMVEAIIRHCDPLIHVMNYRFMGDQHAAFHASLFDKQEEAV